MKTVSIYIILLISNTCVCLDWEKVVILAFFEFEAKIMREFTHSLIPVYCIKFLWKWIHFRSEYTKFFGTYV